MVGTDTFITALDLMEADCDLEPWLGSPDNVPRVKGHQTLDDEPSPGWKIGMDQNVALANSSTDWTFYDGEFDAEDAPEPSEDGETVMWGDDLK
ncbi:hypothetical protein NKJ06_34405 [Mesorhizobium sp. M0293]|uniref:hypothetical protein n=1 Tax=Mesorhizobium sp. M0293 TaxID=2956930 RepID=UPI003338CDE7